MDPRLQLINALHTVSEAMRNCANVADQFQQMISHFPVNANAPQNYPVASGFHNLPQAQPVAVAPNPVAPQPTGGKRKAPATEEDGVKRRKRTPKDPGAPKRPPSSYIFFQNEVRKEIAAQHPDMPNSELLKEVARRWKALTPEQKEVYDKMVRVQKAEYDVAKAAYDKAKAESPIAAIVSPVEVAKSKPKPKPIAVPPPAPVVASPGSSSEEDESSEDQSKEEGSEKSSNSSDSSSEEEDSSSEDEVVAAPAPSRTPKKAEPASSAVKSKAVVSAAAATKSKKEKESAKKEEKEKKPKKTRA